MSKVHLPEDHFPTTGAVSASDIVGRQDAIETLAARLQSGAHSYLAGPRRIGKSSVAEAALAKAAGDSGATNVVIDMLYLTTTMSFASAVFDAIAKVRGGIGGMIEALRQKQRLLDVERTYKGKLGPFFEIGVKLTEAAEEPDAQLRQALGLFGELASDQDRRVLVLLDEFQVSDRIHPQFDEILRHYVADRAQRTTYIFSGSRASILKSKFGTQRRPLFRAAQEVGIPDPDPQEWRPYLERKLREVGIQIDRAGLDKILDESGGHAQDTMLVAAELHLLMWRNQNHFAGYPEVEEAVERVVRGLENSFSQEWSALDKSEQIAVGRIARGQKVYGDLSKSDAELVRRAIKRLEQDGVLNRLGAGDYRLREPLFATYLRKTIISI